MRRLFGWFQGISSAVNIERAYKDLDGALSQLRARTANPDADPPADLEEHVAEAIRDAESLLAFKGEKNWDGLFREMHEYLSKIHMERREYDDAERHARCVLEYDRHEGDYLLQQIDAHKRGERLDDFDPSSVDEADDA